MSGDNSGSFFSSNLGAGGGTVSFGNVDIEIAYGPTIRTSPVDMPDILKSYGGDNAIYEFRPTIGD